MLLTDATGGGKITTTLDYWKGQTHSTNGPMTGRYSERFDPYMHLPNYTGDAEWTHHNHEGEIRDQFKDLDNAMYFMEDDDELMALIGTRPLRVP